MGPYRIIGDHMNYRGPYGAIRDHTGPYPTIEDHIGLDKASYGA